MTKHEIMEVLEDIAASRGSEDIPLSEKSKYTETLLIEGIRSALDKALTNPI